MPLLVNAQVDSFIGDEGATVVAEALKNNYTVKSLDMRGCNVRSDGAGECPRLVLAPAAMAHAPAFCKLTFLAGATRG
jgi:hypothetical protein